jgi:hypothetical protein
VIGERSSSISLLNGSRTQTRLASLAPSGLTSIAISLWVTAGAGRVLAENRRTNARIWDAAALFKRDSLPANVMGGYRFASARILASRSRRSIVAPPLVPIAAADELAIPAFLRRQDDSTLERTTS